MNATTATKAAEIREPARALFVLWAGIGVRLERKGTEALDSSALPFQQSLGPRGNPVPEDGHQQPSDAKREIDTALGVVVLSERPDPEEGPEPGEDKKRYAIEARSHGPRVPTPAMGC